MHAAQQERGGNPALLVIDAQNAVLAESWNGDTVLANIRTVIDTARGDDVPVIYVRHEEPVDEMGSGTDGWQIRSELTPAEGDRIIDKKYPEAFVETTLKVTLAELGVGRLVVTGFQTDGCVRATTTRALFEGYDTVVLSDCHSTCGRTFNGVEVTAEAIVAHFNTATPWILYPGVTSRVESKDAYLAKVQ